MIGREHQFCGWFHHIVFGINHSESVQKKIWIFLCCFRLFCAQKYKVSFSPAKGDQNKNLRNQLDKKHHFVGGSIIQCFCSPRFLYFQNHHHLTTTTVIVMKVVVLVKWLAGVLVLVVWQWWRWSDGGLVVWWCWWECLHHHHL